MFITYELEQTGDGLRETETPPVLAYKEFTVPGEVLSWKVGEFENPSGSNSYGVKVSYLNAEGEPEMQVIPVPASSRNVEVHRDKLPEKFEQAINRAA
ncbi:MAG: hypothetical protein AB1540_00270 [Bdellovibrionota bacterium]